jgi:hypothetical protein
MSEYKLIEINSDLIKVGDEYRTPTTKLPYRVQSIDNYTYNETLKVYERKSVCLWMDNGCLFNTNFKRGVVYKSLEIVNDE